MSKSPETINVDHAFDPQLRQAQADFDTYLETRPYEDVNGYLHDPNTGNFVSEADAALHYSNPDGGVEEVESFDSYYKSMEDLSFSELAKLSAEFKDKDRTYSEDIEYIIRNKILNMGSSTELVDRDWTVRDKSEVDLMFDRVMKLRDSFIQKNNEQSEINDSLHTPDAVKSDEALIPAPDEDTDAWKSRITLDQALHLDKSWLEQTGEWDKNPGNLPKASLTQAWVKANKDKLENQIDNGVYENEEGDFGHKYDENLQDWVPHGPNLDEYMDDIEADSGQIPSAEQITWADDAGDDDIVINPVVAVATGADSWGVHEGPSSLEGTTIGRDTNPENRKTKEKMSRGKKLAVAIGLLVAGALVYSLNNDSKSGEAPITTDEESESGSETDADGTGPLDLSDAEDAFDESGDEDRTDDDSPLDLDDAMDAFDENSDNSTGESDEVEGEDTASNDSEESGDESTDGAAQSLALEDLAIAEDAEPMQANEGNTAWDRAEAQGLDMNKFNEATDKSIDLYNQYAESHDLEKLEYRDGNIWTAGTNSQINPAQYAIYAQIQQDVVAWMTGANPNSPVELPETE